MTETTQFKATVGAQRDHITICAVEAVGPTEAAALEAAVTKAFTMGAETVVLLGMNEVA